MFNHANQPHFPLTITNSLSDLQVLCLHAQEALKQWPANTIRSTKAAWIGDEWGHPDEDRLAGTDHGSDQP